MTDNIVAFDFNGVKVIKDSNTELIQVLETQNSVGTPQSLIDQRDGTNYQVPASKKAHVIYVTTQTWVTNQCPLIYSDTDDAAVNPVTLADPVLTNALTGSIFISAEIPAEKWLVSNSSNATSHQWSVWVVEEAA